MKALEVSRIGDPLEVVQLIEHPEPPAVSGVQVLLQMLYAPINPYDMNIARGHIPVPSFPATLGTEGVARVLEVGNQVENVKVGDVVFIPSGPGSWRERLVVSSNGLFPLPGGADLQQLAMGAANPSTAALMLRNFVDLNPGDWIVQNAGNSAVAASVNAFARARGFRTISLVRRPEAIEAALALGADVVLEDDESAANKIAEATGNAKIRLGLDGVGGSSLMSLTKLVEFGGTVVVYSAMSGQPGICNPMDVIFRDIRIRGIFLGHDHVRNSTALVEGLREGLNLITTGKLHVPVGGVFALENFREAFSACEKGKKILLTAAF